MREIREGNAQKGGGGGLDWGETTATVPKRQALAEAPNDTGPTSRLSETVAL
jgi:hypothetical protein